LTSGYNRDLQLTKKCIVEGYQTTLKSIQALGVALDNMEPNIDNICKNIKNDILAADYATMKARDENIPFRDAYVTVMKEVENMALSEGVLQNIIDNRISEGSPGNFIF